MPRRREQAPAADAPLERFVYRDWADEKADGPVPEHWDPWIWHKIRAFKRYQAAKHGDRAVFGQGQRSVH